jgi:hypothetical protein
MRCRKYQEKKRVITGKKVVLVCLISEFIIP